MTDGRQVNKAHYSKTENTKLKQQTRKTQEHHNKQEYKRETEHEQTWNKLYSYLLYIVLYCNLGASWARSSFGINKILFYRKTKCPIEDAVEKVAADKETAAKLFRTF